MNLRKALEEAIKSSQDPHRKTSFGRDKRAKVDIAAEAAGVALQKLRELSQQNVELEGNICWSVLSAWFVKCRKRFVGKPKRSATKCV